MRTTAWARVTALTLIFIMTQACSGSFSSVEPSGDETEEETTPPDPDGARTTSKMFITGHSLTDFLPNFLPDIVSSIGNTIEYNHQFVPGSPMKNRTGSPSNNWGGYTTGTNRTGSGMNIPAEFLNPQTITGKYDTLVVTERHDLMGPLQYEDTVKVLRNYHDRFIAGNAQGTTYFYESWWNVENGAGRTLTNWIAYERAASPAWQCIATRINSALTHESRADRIKSIPAGAALAELAEKVKAGDIPGLAGGSDATTKATLFTDDVHPTVAAGYYMSLVTYSFVYRTAPTTASAPGAVPSATATALKALAWNFVSTYLANNTPLTLAQCRDYYRDSFCTTFETHAGYTSNGGCANHYSALNDTNELYFNSATNSRYWFSYP